MFYDAIITTNRNYWSTCTQLFHDDYSYMIAFLIYMNEVESFSDYRKMDYKQRPRDFEMWACNYMKNIPEPVCDPTQILRRYEQGAMTKRTYRP